MAKMTGFKYFNGTKAAFESKASQYTDAIVFISGGADSKGSCIFAQGMYFGNFAEFLAAINYVKGVKVGDSQYNAAAGGGYIPFNAADNSTVELNVENGTITVGLTEEFITNATKQEVYVIPTEFSGPSGSLPASFDKDALYSAINEGNIIVVKISTSYFPVINATSNDGASFNLNCSTGFYTYGIFINTAENLYRVSQKQMATYEDVNSAKSAIIGTSDNESTADTIYGAKKYADEKAGAASELAQSAIDRANEVGEDVGDVDTLATENKEVVKAINEVLAAVGTGGTAAVVTVTEKGSTDAYAQVYEIKQGTTTVGTINIPKELVVESGEIVENPSGQAAGTYIKLTLQNVEEPLYIDVAKLVDVYTAQQNATQVQLNVDASNVISATIVASSITSTELAVNAVVTAKIADKNVTKDKLSDAVQTSLGKADTAYQKPTNGIPKSDLEAGVQTSLGKADAAAPQATTYTKTEVDGLIEGIDVTEQLGNYYTKTETYSKAEVDAMWEWEVIS